MLLPLVWTKAEKHDLPRSPYFSASGGQSGSPMSGSRQFCWHHDAFSKITSSVLRS